MQGSIFTLVATLSLVGCGLQAKADKYAPNYAIENDKFTYQDSQIPAQCFSELMIKPEHDNSTAAIFIDNTYLESCLSQPAASDVAGQSINYSIEKILPDHNYNLKVCQAGYCEQIIVAFTSFEYQVKGKSKLLLALVKRGQW